MSKEDGHLPGGKGAERPIRLFDAVNQISGEAEYGAPPPLLQLSRLQDAVVPFGYSLRARQR